MSFSGVFAAVVMAIGMLTTVSTAFAQDVALDINRVYSAAQSGTNKARSANSARENKFKSERTKQQGRLNSMKSERQRQERIGKELENQFDQNDIRIKNIIHLIQHFKKFLNRFLNISFLSKPVHLFLVDAFVFLGFHNLI